MSRLFITLALIGGLSGCVVAPPYGYAPAPAYYAPPVSVGIGGSFRIR
ncbi:hypothetical protein [Burkholderia ubonensis]|nr:hypothetical protein [Burkholderia ubonensis]